jgi:hypothetical protein
MTVCTTSVTRLRRPALAGLAAVLVMAGCASSDAKGDNTAGPKATGSPTASASALPVIKDVVEAGGARLDVPAADWIQVVDGTAWTTLASEAAVRLGSETGKETARIPTGGSTCLAMDVGFESL